MRTKDSTRRTFLKGSLTGTAAIGAGTLALPASAAPGKSGAQKKVVTRPGEPLTPASLFSPATQLGNLLFLSGSGAHDPQTHKVVPGPIGNQVKQCLENLKVGVGSRRLLHGQGAEVYGVPYRYHRFPRHERGVPLLLSREPAGPDDDRGEGTARRISG